MHNAAPVLWLSYLVDVLYKLGLGQDILDKGLVVPSKRLGGHASKRSLLVSSWASGSSHVLRMISCWH